MFSLLIGLLCYVIHGYAVVQPYANDLQKNLNSVTAQTSALDKISACNAAVTLVRAATPLAEKEAILNMVGGLVKHQAALNKRELKALIDVCTLIDENAFILSDEQGQIMAKWLKSLTIAASLARDNEPLLSSLKTFLASSQPDYALLVQACILAGNLLIAAPVNDELNVNNKQSLIYKLKDACKYLYQQRANKPSATITDLSAFLTLAKTNAVLKESVMPAWDTALAIDVALDPASTKTVLDKLKDYASIIPLFTKETDSYEKSLYINALTTLFSNRKDRSVSELMQLKVLLDSLVQKGIFSTDKITQLKRWKDILEGTLAFLGSYDKVTLKEKLRTYQDAIPKITTNNMENTDYEKGVFVQILTEVFGNRGDLVSADLALMKDFFSTVRKTQGLLAQNQLTVVDVWIQEIAAALAMASNKTYLEALIAQASTANSLELFSKALGLFTSSTKQAVKNTFVSALNDLFTKRQTVDTKKLFIFLQAVEQKKLGEDALLTPMQIVILRQWMKALGVEGVIA